jgi:hypothetical protein
LAAVALGKITSGPAALICKKLRRDSRMANACFQRLADAVTSASQPLRRTDYRSPIVADRLARGSAYLDRSPPGTDEWKGPEEAAKVTLAVVARYT